MITNIIDFDTQPKTQVYFWFTWRFILMIGLWYKETKHKYEDGGIDIIESYELWLPFVYFRWDLHYLT